MAVALITGMTGQDGSYLSELLQTKGYKIIGAEKNPDLNYLKDTLAKHKPTEIYNLAAHSSGAGMYDDPISMSEVNGLAVTRLLEAIRLVDPKIKFCQASSREIFGEAVESPQSESTPTCPRSPYGAAKLYADNMIKIYRRNYGLYACSAILFNHESPRRGLEFVTRKITNGAAKIKLGLEKELKLGNLETRRDWGFAGDYVHAMWLMLQQKNPDDFVIATGKTHSVREFCEHAFRYLDLDYKDYVRDDPSAYRPSESLELVGSAKKAKEKLGWKTTISFSELVKMMVESDLKLLKENQ